MIACVDVDYRAVGAVAACVCIGKWSDGTSVLESTAAGIDVAEAANHIRAMHGPHRIPTLLKRVDQLSRSQVDPDSR